MGESPYTKNLFLACGFNSSGIASAGGAGLALSEWIIEKGPTRDLYLFFIDLFYKKFIKKK